MRYISILLPSWRARRIGFPPRHRVYTQTTATATRMYVVSHRVGLQRLCVRRAKIEKKPHVRAANVILRFRSLITVARRLLLLLYLCFVFLFFYWS